MSYEYKVTSKYCWYDYESHSKIVKMYFINGMPFTFDELENGQTYDQDIISEAKKTGISYYSLYNTYKNVKSLIKTEIQWD